MQGSNRRPSRLGGFELREFPDCRISRDARLAIRLGFSQVARLELREPVKLVVGDVGIKPWTLPSPTPSIRAAPTRRRSFAAASPRPDLRLFGRGPRFFKVAFRLRALLLHRGQCAEVEINDRPNDAAMAQVSASRGRLPKQRESAAGAEQLDPNQGPEILAEKARRRFFLAGQYLDVEAGKLDFANSSRTKPLRLSRIGRFPPRSRNALGKLAG